MNALTAIGINHHIQHVGPLVLDGKAIICVALDGTCTFEDDSEKELTDGEIWSLLLSIERSKDAAP